MNKDKSIKDLKKRNDQLVYQYRMRDIRCITLERRTEKYEQQIAQLTNNWNELEEWIKNNAYDIEVLDKMKEIKEGNNEPR